MTGRANPGSAPAPLILQSSTDDTIRLRLGNFVFVSVFNPGAAKGCAAKILGDFAGGREALTQLLKEIEAQVGARASACEVKLVGSAGLLEEARAALKEQAVVPKACAERKAGAEVIFYPGSGRLQAMIETPEPARIPSRSPPSGRKLKVLVVDDSPTLSKLLCGILTSTDIEVVATAQRPSLVEGLILSKQPDVITLDLRMPEMDGVTLLKSIFPKYPIPVVVISALSMEDGPLVLEALENGAVDYIQKPSFDELDKVSVVILEKIRTAAQAKLALSPRVPTAPGRPVAPRILGDDLIAIGASTGGTEALKHLLIRLPDRIPPIVIVQHIPPIFSKALAKRLDEMCPFEIREAENGDEVLPNRALIAPGGLQMAVVREGQKLKISLTDSAPINRHKPSVDVLFNSVAEVVGNRSIGVILTGMGSDGANGLLRMRKAGARTVAQDEASCVVYGMPKEAVRLGAAQEVKPLLDIPALIISWLSKKTNAA